MKKFMKKIMDLDTPVLTKMLASKLAPFAKVLYAVLLVIIAFGFIGSLGLLLSGDISLFLATLLGLVAEFTLVRMFCEYLVSANPKAKK